MKIVPDKITQAAINRMYNERITKYKWELKLSLMPRRCCITKETLPLFKKAYRGYRIIAGPGENLIMVNWMSPGAYMMEKLKGNIA